jgi:hypothetical protein
MESWRGESLEISVRLFFVSTFLTEMDTTMLSDIDYLNILPDMDKMDIEESSFLKGNSSFNNNQSSTNIEG